MPSAASAPMTIPTMAPTDRPGLVSEAIDDGFTTATFVTVAVTVAKLEASEVFKSVITAVAKSCFVIKMVVLREDAAAASATIMRDVTSMLAVASRRPTG